MSLWGVDAILSDQIAATTFLVIDAGRAVIHQRMQNTVDISDHHRDNYTKNLLTIRAECRLALVLHNAKAAVTGTLYTSPAS
jgi:HK97 family phage major capsid protein